MRRGWGATALLGSPLSLRLLHAAVTNGSWPKTRYELFKLAIPRLAAEHNTIHQAAPRTSIDRIVEAAETMCLALLLSGSRAIWRSAGLPPEAGTDARAYLSSADLGMDANEFQDTLDSSLFRGEGQIFEPMHRTLAEYLAGRGLARAVIGNSTQTAFPFSRAIAMLSGIHGKAPTELRGLMPGSQPTSPMKVKSRRPASSSRLTPLRSSTMAMLRSSPRHFDGPSFMILGAMIPTSEPRSMAMTRR